MLRAAWSITLILIGSAAGLRAQEATDGASAGAPLVYLDCTGSVCDYDYYRRTIAFVQWATDPAHADLHVRIAAEAAAAGATRFTLRLVGRREFEGTDQRNRYTAPRDATLQETREAVGRTLALALAGLLAGAPAADRLRLAEVPGRPGTVNTGEDPWNHWVFRTGLSGSAAGERLTRSFSLSVNASAVRTTAASRFELRGAANHDETRFELDSTTTITSVVRSQRWTGLLVGSVGRHWSVGARVSAASSSFLNQRRLLRFAPAVEYSFFPYEQSSERQLRILYAVGVNDIDYREETIYRTTAETLYDHALTLSLELTQPWGSAKVEVEGLTWLHDFEQNSVGLSVNTDWRIFRGLSFFLLGDVTHVANQRSLPSGGVSEIEILLRRRQLATSFRYSASLGFGYSFGSRVSNIVNPRFRS